MSAVTLQEIADLVAAALKVPVSAMRGLKKGSAASEHIARARTARNVVIVLARRHTQLNFVVIAGFFGLAVHGTLRDRLAEIVDTAEPGWLSDDPCLHGSVEEVEQQIDALHDRRIAERDRKVVRV